MTEIARSSGEAERDLLARASGVIEEGQAAAARQANLALTLTFWRLGRLVGDEVLGSERAAYGEQIVVSLGRQLVERYGRSYEEKNLRRMIQFAQQFPDEQIVVSLGRQLSWTHFRALLPLKTPEARAFYVQEAVGQGLSVRGLRQLIARKGYERREIANAQIVGETAVPRDVFRDPYLLDFLGLEDTFLEHDLEAAIIRDMEAFLLEAGNGFAFVERQKRMIIDDDDYHLDLLFFSRPLRRLVAVGLARGDGQVDPVLLRCLLGAVLHRDEIRVRRGLGDERNAGLTVAVAGTTGQAGAAEAEGDGHQADVSK